MFYNVISNILRAKYYVFIHDAICTSPCLLNNNVTSFPQDAVLNRCWLLAARIVQSDPTDQSFRPLRPYYYGSSSHSNAEVRTIDRRVYSNLMLKWWLLMLLKRWLLTSLFSAPSDVFLLFCFFCMLFAWCHHRRIAYCYHPL